MARNLEDLARVGRRLPHLHAWFWGNPDTAFAGWQVVGAGFAGADYRAAHPIPRRRMGHWLLLCAHAGTGWFTDAQDRRHPWTPGTGVLLAPGQEHAYGSSDRAWIEWWLLFDGPATVAAHGAGDLVADARPIPSPAAYHRIAMAVVDACLRSADGHRDAGGRLVGLLAESLHGRRPERRTTDDPAIRALQGELAAHPERRWSLRAVARRHGMGYDAMRHRFRAAFGVPPLAFLRRERIHRSCKLLVEGATVAEAAEAVGFGDPFFFSRTFRSLIGTSPRDFVRQSALGDAGEAQRPTPPGRTRRGPHRGA